MLAREAEFTRKVFAYEVAVEHRHAARSDFQQLYQQGVCDGRFARTRKTGEENCEPLPVLRRMGTAQLSDDLRIGEPFRDLEPFAQAAPELGAGQAQNLHVLCDLVLRNELR